MKKRLFGLIAIPLIAIGSLTYANDFIVPDTENGTITVYSQDYSYGITIQDKNLGATDVGDYGYYYQWGNNHGNSGDSSTVSTLLSTDDLSNWANKGYSGNVTQFIKEKNSYGDYRSGLANYNETGAIQHSLWGGGNDNDDSDANIVKGYDTVNHVVTNPDNRQGPCPEGYHVPSAGEWQELMMLWCNANPDICSGSVISTQNGEDAWANHLGSDGIGTAFSNDLQLPLAGERRSFNASVFFQEIYARYWSSSPRGGSNPERAWYLYFGTMRVNPGGNYNRAYGYSVRCFKNSYVKLPKTLNLFFMPSTGDVQEVGTGEVSENMTGAVPEEAKNVRKTGYVLEYRYLSGADATTGFDFENTPISGDWADESGNVYFIAQWTGIKYSVEFTGKDVEGTMENQTFTYDITGTLTPNAFTKTGYTFSGWTDGTTGYTDGQEVVNLTTTSEDVITLTAEWTKIETKPSGGYSGGGGRSSKTSYTQDSSTSSQNDNKSSSGTEVKDLKGDTKDSSDKSSEGQNQQQFTQEFQEAYEFAKEKGITTMPTINDANMNGKLTRIAMAKMLSYYAINVLGQKPDETRINKFNDITEKLDAQYDSGVTLAYQLGIMGINMPDNNFRPNDEVTRAEFATALSRLLFDTPDGEDVYYSTHLEKLLEEKIITNDNPNLQESRGYVMIMLMRSAK